MTPAIKQAFLELRPSGRVAVAQHLGITMSQGSHETDTQYAIRLLQMIEKDGNVRLLEQALMAYT